MLSARRSPLIVRLLFGAILISRRVVTGRTAGRTGTFRTCSSETPAALETLMVIAPLPGCSPVNGTVSEDLPPFCSANVCDISP
ncbi:hypothetical protein D3C78_1155060 [compost metagenome]